MADKFIILNNDGTKSAKEVIISGISHITGTEIINFNFEQDVVVKTINNAQITNSNFKSFTYQPQETAETSLDDFSLNGVTFSIENIVDNISFDIRATAFNNASGNYTIKYTIII